jgi:competence protein ComFC
MNMHIMAQVKTIFLDFLFPDKPDQKKLISINRSEIEAKLAPITTKLGELFSVVSYFRYSDPVIKGLILRLKTKGCRITTEKMVSALFDDLLEEISEKTIYEGFDSPVVIPVPLSRARLADRGFNQSVIIAEELVKLHERNKLILMSDNLVKTKNTRTQVSLKNKADRQNNLRGCFKVKYPEKIKGRNIILVDDVMTTGATLTENYKTLKDAGANNVFAVTLAR